MLQPRPTRRRLGTGPALEWDRDPPARTRTRQRNPRIDVTLVPLGGSPVAEAALSHALEVQKAFGARLILLRVVGGSGEATNGVEWRLYEVAHEQCADLIVLTSHGRGGAERFQVGGTAHKVLSAGETSVHLVRVTPDVATWTANGRWHSGTLTHIVAATDGSSRSEWARCGSVSGLHRSVDSPDDLAVKSSLRVAR